MNAIRIALIMELLQESDKSVNACETIYSHNQVKHNNADLENISDNLKR